MAFKLSLEINDDGSTKVDFDGNVNHIVLLGVLESVKHSVLLTADNMAGAPLAGVSQVQPAVAGSETLTGQV